MVRISLYEHENYEGRELIFDLFDSTTTLTYEVVNVDKLLSGNFNDIASSLRINNSYSNYSCTCYFFEHSNLVGRFLAFGVQQSSGMGIQSLLNHMRESGTLNERISSILIVRHSTNSQNNEIPYPLNRWFGRTINQKIEDYFNSGGSVGGGGGLFSHSIERESVRISFDATAVLPNGSGSYNSYVNVPLINITLPLYVTVHVPVFGDSHYNVEIIFHIKLSYSNEISLNPETSGHTFIIEAKRVGTDFTIDEGNFQGQIRDSINGIVGTINSTLDLYLKDIVAQTKNLVGNGKFYLYLLPGEADSRLLLGTPTTRPNFYEGINNDVSLVFG